MFWLVLTWLVAVFHFGKKTREDWKKVIVSYDMCHLNNLKVSKRLLPLPGDLAYIWYDVTKIIDSLHCKSECVTLTCMYHVACVLNGAMCVKLEH